MKKYLVIFFSFCFILSLCFFASADAVGGGYTALEMSVRGNNASGTYCDYYSNTVSNVDGGFRFSSFQLNGSPVSTLYLSPETIVVTLSPSFSVSSGQTVEWLGGFRFNTFYFKYVQVAFSNDNGDFVQVFEKQYSTRVRDTGDISWGYDSTDDFISHNFKISVYFSGYTNPLASQSSQSIFYIRNLETKVYTTPSPNSPERPSFGSPDRSEFDEMESAEEAVLDSQSESLENASSFFGSFDLGDFAVGLSGWLTIFNELTGGLPWLNSLLFVSLSIGLCTFILGVGHVFVGRVDAHQRQVAHDRAESAKAVRKRDAELRAKWGF